MPEGFGYAAYDLEPKLLPQAHCSLIAADYKVELHRPEAEVFCVVERMCAHGARNSATEGRGRRDVAAVRDMSAAALLVGMNEIGADNLSIFFSHEDGIFGRQPIGQ